MTGTRRWWAGALAALLLVGCTSPASDAPSPTTETAATSAPAGPQPSPTPPTTEPTPPPAAFGTGTVTVDGTQLPVSGDCDISRDFGEEPVEGLDDEQLDVLLAVDNLTGDGGHDGAFPIEVTLLGSGPLVGRPITSAGGPGEGGNARYEGTVEVAALRDREAREFLDAATLHLEATQHRGQGSGEAATRTLVVDVVCPITRPS